MTQEIKYDCATCGTVVSRAKSDIPTDGGGGYICDDCASPQEWDDVEFPVWVDVEYYDDTWGLGRNFCRQTGLPEGEMTREMKYTVFRAWYKVLEDGTVEGPYTERNGERF